LRKQQQQQQRQQQECQMVLQLMHCRLPAPSISRLPAPSTSKASAQVHLLTTPFPIELQQPHL
jgi:hypothetical protein